MPNLSPHTLIYCHGLPGSGAEISSLVAGGDYIIHAIGSLDMAGFDAVMANTPGDTAHIIAFSLGAMTALKLAATRPAQVQRLNLIAPAAPLELGAFLPKMAGRPVFQMAAKGALAFRFFTAVQRLGLAAAPQKILQTMFNGSPQSDLDLLDDPDFRATLLRGMRHSFGADRKAYHAAIMAYVKPWADVLSGVTCPVTIHHSRADNWAPIDMAHALEAALPTKVNIVRYDGLGHYGTLHAALPEIITPYALPAPPRAS